MPPSTTVAAGLDSPRGLAFGPDGLLYVAEGGRGGPTTTTDSDCPQIPPPVGPYSGGMTARVSRIGRDGRRTTIVDGLPSSQTSPGSGGNVSGVADVAFVGETLYALVAGGGCSHGLAGTTNGIYRVAGGRATLVADLGTYRRTHPVARPDPNDDEYDGTWYGMVEAGGALYAVEPNNGEVVRFGLEGSIRRLVDISASHGHIVPTAIAHLAGRLYVGNLGRFPLVHGSSVILEMTAGRVREVAAGLTAVLGLAFDPAGRLHALESTIAEGRRPQPNTGRVVRTGDGGRVEAVAAGLMLPTAMTFGPDGGLYVSTWGFGPPGEGTIVRIELE